MPIAYDYIREVLSRFEGAGRTRGYVPCDKTGRPLGASGVTIGTGVDLGQQTGAGLLDMGVPHAVVKKLLPYIGLKKEAALAGRLSRDERQALKGASKDRRAAG